MCLLLSMDSVLARIGDKDCSWRISIFKDLGWLSVPLSLCLCVCHKSDCFDLCMDGSSLDSEG